MKKLLVAIFAVVLGFSGLFAAEALSKKGMAGPLEVEYSSEKPLSQGMNMINIKVKENGKEIKDAKVSVTASMPAMPGMPAMEQSSEAMFVNGAYMAHVTFSMNGTWQLSIVIETSDGKKQRLKSSVNL
ncbi:YtkA-like protein [Sulfurospirillum diekertiae]|uniref:YtkA-like protein n=1 Tax=Sulfurospirillum diekertiae TaxID=1854492 RepID=A0A290HYW0_9BACT|nr:FixH family protein [Sulfurospirillum diekertiae]ATB70840.1 YtkA-like protein [Sulfurospirillum diekertiae]